MWSRDNSQVGPQPECLGLHILAGSCLAPPTVMMYKVWLTDTGVAGYLLTPETTKKREEKKRLRLSASI